MDRLLTQQDLADRWQVTVQSIENWRRQGLISTAKGVPCIRFTEQHILELEGVKLEKVSPLMVRRLERELEDYKTKYEMLKGVLANILAESTKVINI